MKAFLTIALSILSVLCHAQDERYYRKIFTGELTEKTKELQNYKVTVQSPRYEIDLNQDKIMESIRVEKRDGKDFFFIYNEFGVEIFSKTLPGIGGGSRLIKVDLKSISKNTNALILHFYEGAINASKFEAMAKLYFISIDKNDFKKIGFFKGPHFFYESQKDSSYINRRYTVNAYDYNKDGIRELSINYNKIARIYFYKGLGEWKQI